MDLVEQVFFLDSQLAGHLSSTQVAKYTSKTSQNELLDCMLAVYDEKLANEISQAPFVAASVHLLITTYILSCNVCVCVCVCACV